MPYTERPDIAQLGARAIQNAVYGPEMIQVSDDSMLPQKQTIYVYNISKREIRVPRPPNFPHFLVRACGEQEDCKLVGTIEHPYPQREEDSNQQPIVRYVNGFREATRLLSPMNPGTDQDFDSPDGFLEGGNLNNYGVFWSTHGPDDPALQPEIEKFRARMEKTYRAELEKLAAVESKNPDDARAMANDISHAAANYFGVSTSWHRSDLRPTKAGKVPCWACGEDIKAAALICLHCKAPQQEERREAWLDSQIGPEKRGPGRPRSN